MTITAAVSWWVLAGVLVAVELLTGSFYLLALAIGAGAGALAAHSGQSLTVQLVVAAVVGGGSIAFWHMRRARHPQSAPVQANRDALMDIGERVDVVSWDDQGEAQVQYRGSSWSAIFKGDGPPAPGPHVIASIRGNQLELAAALPAAKHI